VPVRAVQITRVGDPDVLDVVDIPEPEAGPGRRLYDVSAAGINDADTHRRGTRSALLCELESRRLSFRWCEPSGCPGRPQ
jgi:NADPH:quinone reductase-like Zn-dependent oxidoreductase